MIAEKLANLRRGVLNAQSDGRPIEGAELNILADNLHDLALRVAELERHQVPAGARYVGVDLAADGGDRSVVIDLTKRRRPRPRLAQSDGPDGGSAA